MAVAWKATDTFTTDGGTSIAMTVPTEAEIGDLLIAYIAKDDNVDIDETGAYASWNMLCNVIDDSQTCLYVAWRIADSGDAETPTEYTWNGDSEDWIGSISVYSGADPDNPIHASGSAYLDSSATPTAPSVAFTDLTAGSLVFQCFGCDFDDTPRTLPSELTSRFNLEQATDIGGAGGDKTGKWVSPTGFVDPDTQWTDEEKAYDEDTALYAYDSIGIDTWGSYLELTISAISCSKVRFWAYYNATYMTQISLDVYYSSDWHNIYEGSFADQEWVEKAIGSTQTVTAMRMKFHSGILGSDAKLYEADFLQDVSSGTGSTGTAVFGIPASNEWTAATVIIEAAAGGEVEKLQGTSVNTLTAVGGTVNASFILQGTSVNAFSSTGGYLGLAHKLLGTSVNATTAVGDSVAITKKLSGTAVCTFSTTGDVITAVLVLQGTSVNTIATSSALSLVYHIAGTSEDYVSAVAGYLDNLYSLVGTSVNAISTSGGHLGKTHNLSGTSASAISTSAIINLSFILQGTSVNATSTIGAFGVTLDLSGTSVNAISAVGAIGVTLDLAGTSVNSTSTVGALNAVFVLEGTSANVISTTGSLGTTYHLSGTSVNSTTTTGGTLDTPVWLPNFDNRIKLTIDHTKIDSALTHFPVTVFLSSTHGDCVFDELTADANRFKIAFAKANSTTELYGEIEKWDDANESAIIHVSKDGWDISDSVNTDFYMYYDIDHADNTTYIGDIDSTPGAAVWDSNFNAVYHMVDATTSTIKDSTSNNNDGTKKGANEPVEAAGKVGQGQDFDGTDDLLNTGSSTQNFDGGGVYSVIFKPGQADYGAADGLIYSGNDNYLQCNGTEIQARIVDDDAKVAGIVHDTTGFNTSNWYYAALVLEADMDVHLYVDGSLETSDTTTLTSNTLRWLNFDYHTIGHRDKDDAVPDTFFDGIIDEVRISNAERSAAWIKAEYESLWDSLLTYGDEEGVLNLSGTSVNSISTSGGHLGKTHNLSGTSVSATSTIGIINLSFILQGTSVNSISTIGVLNASLTLKGTSANTVSTVGNFGITLDLSGTSVNAISAVCDELWLNAVHWTEEEKEAIVWAEEEKEAISWDEESKSEISWDEESKGEIDWTEETKPTTTWTEERKGS